MSGLKAICFDDAPAIESADDKRKLDLGVDRSSREEREILGARTKLNSVYVLGCLAVAAIIGAVAGSWIVFAIFSAVLIGCSVSDGGIRPTRRR